MTMRTMLGLSVLALLGGAVTAGIMSASPPTASASSPPTGVWDPGDAEWVCYVNIENSNVEGSNICSPDATAKSVEIRKVERDGHDGPDGGDQENGHDGDESTVIVSGDDTTIVKETENEETNCTNVGLVSTQFCDVVDDVTIVRDVTVIGEENQVLSENGILLLSPFSEPRNGVPV